MVERVHSCELLQVSKSWGSVPMSGFWYTYCKGGSHLSQWDLQWPGLPSCIYPDGPWPFQGLALYLRALRRALLGIWPLSLTSSGRGPSVQNQVLIPPLTAPLKTSSLTGSFIEGCTDRHISLRHWMTSVHVWSQDQLSVSLVAFSFLRVAGSCIQASSYLLLPFPSHSPSTKNSGVMW